MESGTAVTSEDVLLFWFGAPGDDPKAVSARWFTRDEGFDRAIEARFGATLEAAARGELEEWKATPRGRLALVVVLDQFSRNVHRGTPRAFAQDRLAVEASLSAIDHGDEGALSLDERQFLYMPLMHAENVDLQRKCVAAFKRLLDRAPADRKEAFADALRYAKLHADIIERFGRFPHRNAILGRPSTREEEEFLKQPGSSF